MNFNVKSSTLTSSPSKIGYTPSAKLTTVNVCGVMSKPDKVLVNGKSITTFKYDSSLLEVQSLDLNFATMFTIAWS